MVKDLSQRINMLAEWMFVSRHLIVFTGAGISTESGIPDFRGPDGLWTRKEKGLPVENKDWSKAEPNAGHLAVLNCRAQ